MNSINFKTLGLGMLAVLAISSCVKETPVESQTQPAEDMMTITLSTEIQSKTTMTPGATKLSWTSGDKFDLFSNGGDGKTTPEYVSDDTVIEARVNKGATEIYAIYPSVAANTKSAVTVNIPASQTQAVAGQMNGSNIPMHAKGTIEDNSAVLSFRPVAGIIALNVYSTDATDAKVKKVQINPLDAEGNFIYSGYCGSVTVAADEFSYDPTEDVNGVTLTLGTPCSLPSEKPADQAATLNFANQLYIGIARGTYAGLQFIVTTDDGKMYVATSRTERSFENTDIHYINLNIAGKDEISDDFYGQYNAGLDLTICGNVINKKTYPKAQLKTMDGLDWGVLAQPFNDETNGGILFIDNPVGTSATKASGKTNRVIGKDRIIIGRYRNGNQPVFRYTVSGNLSWAFSGKAMVKNVTFSLFQDTPGRPLIIGASGVSNGESEFYFEDCTFTSIGGKGIFACNSSSWTVPKSMRFDNCILRADAQFFNTSESNASATTTSNVFNSLASLESISCNNCVFAPVSSTNVSNAAFATEVSSLNVDGVLVAFYRPGHKLDNLNVSFSYCSFYELGPAAQTHGMVYLTTLKNVHFEYCIFSNSSWVKNSYLLQVLEATKDNAPASYTGRAVYTNSINTNNKQYLAVGSSSGFTSLGISRTLSITNKGSVDLFATPEPAKHYFPLSSSLDFNGGASYDTKYWIVPTPAAE